MFVIDQLINVASASALPLSPSPTHAMLLIGRHPIRVGTVPEVGGELELQETTIAEGFKANCYPESTGVLDNKLDIRKQRPDTVSMPQRFKESG